MDEKFAYTSESSNEHISVEEDEVEVDAQSVDGERYTVDGMHAPDLESPADVVLFFVCTNQTLAVRCGVDENDAMDDAMDIRNSGGGFDYNVIAPGDATAASDDYGFGSRPSHFLEPISSAPAPVRAATQQYGDPPEWKEVFAYYSIYNPKTDAFDSDLGGSHVQLPAVEDRGIPIDFLPDVSLPDSQAPPSMDLSFHCGTSLTNQFVSRAYLHLCLGVHSVCARSAKCLLRQKSKTIWPWPTRITRDFSCIKILRRSPL